MTKPILILTPGDPDGIGPEITWKVIQRLHAAQRLNEFTLLCVGAQRPFDQMAVPIDLFNPALPLEQELAKHQHNSNKTPRLWLFAAPSHSPQSQLLLAGHQAGWSIQSATRLVLEGVGAALVTGPIHKDRLQQGGYPYPGHTEFLAHLCNTPAVTMMLAHSQLKISLVTIHLALKDVPTNLSQEKIKKTILQTAEGLKNWWGIPHPKIAVTALNPHGGESGLFGREEMELIQPALQELRNEDGQGFQISGPFPADTFFATQIQLRQKDRFDAVVCMYHDQGLIPVKLLDFHRTVNITLGLPMIRTSVDHGVGFDIAGQGIANPSSLESAIELAVNLIQRK